MSDLKQPENNCTETVNWNVTCHYDKVKESSNFMECMALFMLEKEQGWDAGFRPIVEHNKKVV